MHDLIIRGGTVVDGTGGAPFEADVAVDGGAIAKVGKVTGKAREEIDARGLLVTPGIVDIHTHFDAQVTWDPMCTPSCYHGVTTVVFGNCGVGFAPAAPDGHAWLIDLMEGVEDIPNDTMAEGIRWNWESYPEYLDYVEGLPLMLDVGTQIPHAVVRAYVMGERGAKNEPATGEDIEKMAAIVREAMQVGALGLSMSRTINHRAVDGARSTKTNRVLGENMPGTFAAEDELLGLGRVLGELGRGLLEIAPGGMTGDDLSLPFKEIAWMRRLAGESGRPVFHAVTQHDVEPNQWKELLELSAEASAEGAPLVAQVAARPIGILLGLDSRHPFVKAPSFEDLRPLPRAEKVARLRDPELRRRLIDEAEHPDTPALGFIDPMWRFTVFEKMFPLDDPPDYEPPPEQSLATVAAREGRSGFEVFYDRMLEQEGRQIFLAPLLNYSDYSLDPTYEMLTHPHTVVSLGDAGAHCGVICDASGPTTLLSFWTRDRTRGATIPLERAVKMCTQDTASLYGLHDRGVIRPGMLADLNVIDYDALRLRLPEFHHDLPAGGGRWVQKADGYRYTIKRGVVIMRDGAPSGLLPGRLIRGEQAAPAGA